MPQKFHFDIIDIFRFISALAVVLFHYSFRGYAIDNKSILFLPALGHIFRYGYLGVNFFFIISGFVIFFSIQNKTPLQFVIARISRLFPSYWLCLIFTTLFIYLVGDQRFPVTFDIFLINLTMLQNMFHIMNIDGVYWTLFFELIFYFWVFVLMSIGHIKEWENLVGILLFLALINIKYPLSIMFIFILPFISFFIYGSIIYLCWLDGFTIKRSLLLFASAVIGTCWQALETYSRSIFYHHATFSPWIVSCILLVMYLLFLLIPLLRLERLSIPYAAALGGLTYPLYLLHQDIGYILFNKFSTNQNKYFVFIAVLSLMLMIAHIINRFYEPIANKLLKQALTRVFLWFTH